MVTPLVAALILQGSPKPFKVEASGYELSIVPDSSGARVELTGPGQPGGILRTKASQKPEVDPPHWKHVRAWTLHLDFVPQAARVNWLGRTVLLGSDLHAVVTVDPEGHVAKDMPLAAIFRGVALQTALARVRQGKSYFDEAGFAAGRTIDGQFRFNKVRGVTLRRPPLHRGFTIFQSTVFILGEDAFFARVGNAYAWFDPVDGELLSRDTPTQA